VRRAQIPTTYEVALERARRASRFNPDRGRAAPGELMQTLTRRRDNHEGWYVHFGDVRVGHIGTRAGVPHDVEQWGWYCGFYPGCDRGQATDGCAECSRRRRLSSRRPGTGCGRHEPRLTSRCSAGSATSRHGNTGYDEHLPLPTQTHNDRARCFCGAELTNRCVDAHIQQAHRGIGG
jgi:hypothetical protein